MSGFHFRNPGFTGNLLPPFTIATGGTITDIGNYRYHAFTSTGTSTFTVSNIGTSNLMDVLVVAGGGSGIQTGGGAGGVVLHQNRTMTVRTYTVTVGAGGIQSNGQNSVFDNITALGGGASGISNDTRGSDGGSGGGAGRDRGSIGLRTQFNSGGGTGYGNNGGNASQTGWGGGGGGGGAGGVGGNGGGNGVQSGEVPGPGGPGINFSSLFPNWGTNSSNTLTGTRGWFGGGGGSSAQGNASVSVGGVGGGANGNQNSNSPVRQGIPNTGGGGAGSGGGGTGGHGGSGIVIIRYLLA
jgi:hypothetical protein